LSFVRQSFVRLSFVGGEREGGGRGEERRGGVGWPSVKIRTPYEDMGKNLQLGAPRGS